MSDAVEELLRIDSPFISIGRTAMHDGVIGDQAIRGGDKVVLYWASANRDRAEFSAPDEFDLGRERNRHFAFGVGPHRCAGSNLARLNLRIGLDETLRRLHDIRLSPATAGPGPAAQSPRLACGSTHRTRPRRR